MNVFRMSLNLRLEELMNPNLTVPSQQVSLCAHTPLVVMILGCKDLCSSSHSVGPLLNNSLRTGLRSYRRKWNAWCTPPSALTSVHQTFFFQPKATFPNLGFLSLEMVLEVNDQASFLCPPLYLVDVLGQMQTNALSIHLDGD